MAQKTQMQVGTVIGSCFESIYSIYREAVEFTSLQKIMRLCELKFFGVNSIPPFLFSTIPLFPAFNNVDGTGFDDVVL